MQNYALSFVIYFISIYPTLLVISTSSQNYSHVSGGAGEGRCCLPTLENFVELRLHN